MFPLVRYYTAGSIAVILAAVVIVNLISSRVERSTVIERLKHESVEAVLPGVFSFSEQLSLRAGEMGKPEEEVAADEQWMDRAVLNEYRGWPLVRFDLVANDGTVVYSTVPLSDLLARPKLADQILAQLASGKPVSEYVEDMNVTLLTGENRTMDTVEVFVPLYREGFSSETGHAPWLIFVIGRDVTSTVDAATSSAVLSRIIMLSLTMTAMFLALLFIVWRGQRFTRAIRNRLAAEVLRQRELAEELDSQNEALTDANAAKTRFLNLVSHELKTPLTAVLAFSDILKRNKEGNLTERQLKHVSVVHRSGEQLKMLIEDLLDIAKIDAGKFSLGTGPLDIRDLVRDVAEGVSHLFDAKAQMLEVTLPQESLAIEADRQRISQVIINLLGNASKYSPPNTRTSIALEYKGDAVHVAVRDAGIGISEEDQQRLFGMFFRADNPETQSVSGSGLGLVIVKSIIEMHGGRVSVVSKRGEGSTFSFWVPISQAGSEAATANSSQTGEPSGFGPENASLAA